MSFIKREWIDESLAHEVNALVISRVNNRPHSMGLGLATLSLAVVGSITSLEDDDDTKKEMLIEVIKFMTDLHNNGFKLKSEWQ